ncbi:MAG: peptidoglycan-binding protein [Bacteroidales bacterium]|nr:peptidoglycan-binding protein [Candidatus Physcousia equi]
MDFYHKTDHHHRHDKSPEIERAQRMLNDIRRDLHTDWEHLADDGDFGPRTERALKAFQVYACISPSGHLDDNTCAKISEVWNTARSSVGAAEAILYSEQQKKTHTSIRDTDTQVQPKMQPVVSPLLPSTPEEVHEQVASDEDTPWYVKMLDWCKSYIEDVYDAIKDGLASLLTGALDAVRQAIKDVQRDGVKAIIRRVVERLAPFANKLRSLVLHIFDYVPFSDRLKRIVEEKILPTIDKAANWLKSINIRQWLNSIFSRFSNGLSVSQATSTAAQTATQSAATESSVRACFKGILGKISVFSLVLNLKDVFFCIFCIGDFDYLTFNSSDWRKKLLHTFLKFLDDCLTVLVADAIVALIAAGTATGVLPGIAASVAVGIGVSLALMGICRFLFGTTNIPLFECIGVLAGSGDTDVVDNVHKSVLALVIN